MSTRNVASRVDPSGLGCHRARKLDGRKAAVSQQKSAGYVRLVGIGTDDVAARLIRYFLHQHQRDVLRQTPLLLSSMANAVSKKTDCERSRCRVDYEGRESLTFNGVPGNLDR